MLPCAAGVAVSDDGQTLVVANYYDDSISVFTGGLGNWTPLSSLTTEKPGELDLRPGKAASSPRPGSPGGEYPFWVVNRYHHEHSDGDYGQLGVHFQHSRP